MVVCALKSRSFKRYFFLNVYMGLSFFVSVGRFQILSRLGMASLEYAYFYFYSDALLTIGLYFALLNLYSLVFDEMKVERYLRLGAIFLLGGTAWFSYAVVQQSSHRILSHFAFELSQNLYFVGLILTYALWGAILKLRETRARLIQLVLALGVYFSAFAADYALRNLYPNAQSIFHYVTPLLGCVLPAAWTYTFLRVSEEARLAPSRLATVPR
ncbi:MAG: hypothetical protein DMG35_17230 [Acidobacteria bacterium]|nr:MAG: hypothetical protein AUH86_02510 [Acidobacteria bacterium 13_1_40CM_4_58_4]PYT58570.1 MAG: hypothetical protein DMG35_17230 [Acidobacteriota bacterium]